MKNKSFIVIFIIAAFVTCCMPGCSPKAVVKDPNAALSGLKVDITEEEYKEWKKLASEGINTAERAKGAFWAGQYCLNKNDIQNAEKYFGHNERYYSDIIWGYLSVLRLSEISVERKDTETALKKFKILAEKRHQFPEFKDAVLGRLKEIISAQDMDGLKKIYAARYHALIDEYALYYIIKQDIKNNNSTDFFTHARSFVMEYRDSEFYQEVSDEFRKAVLYKPVNKRKIGVILPLTGKGMAAGESIKNAIEMGVAEFNAEIKEDEEKLALVFVDESMESEALVKKIVKVIEEDNVIAFAGPVFSNNVKKIAPLLESYNVTSFSSTAARPDLTGASPYFFRNCGTVKGHAYAMAKYITDRTPYRKVASLYPNDALGKSLNDFFVEKILQGASLAGSVGFEPSKSDFLNYLVPLGGINTMLLKEKRAAETRAVNDKMEEAGRQVLEKAFEYMKVYRNWAATDVLKEEDLPKVNIALLRFSSEGENVKRYNLDIDMTKQMSYAMARDEKVFVAKQAQTDGLMDEIGVEPEDVDREIALNIAQQLKSDILVWGIIEERQSNTIYASFIPKEAEYDSQGNTKYSYSFTDEDYLYFDVTIRAISVTDETAVDEVKFTVKKLKEPVLNPLGLEAVFVPATERKITLIRDQLKYYDLDLPIFCGTFDNPAYLLNFMESSQGIHFTSEFYPDEPSENIQKFIADYKEKYAAMPGVIEANTYDTIKIMTAILQSGAESREAFKDMLKSVRNYEGVTGRFSFDANNDPIKEYYIMKIEDGIKILGKIKGE
ncbi:MAG: ABC transporter substrate-binding protein [Candidatus Goldbacteria bacterium]|nr:ABC transporter substrate-binding protein [Candidatus Goldiibacteriota bacterium]